MAEFPCLVKITAKINIRVKIQSLAS